MSKKIKEDTLGRNPTEASVEKLSKREPKQDQEDLIQYCRLYMIENPDKNLNAQYLIHNMKAKGKDKVLDSPHTKSFDAPTDSNEGRSLADKVEDLPSLLERPDHKVIRAIDGSSIRNLLQPCLTKVKKHERCALAISTTPSPKKGEEREYDEAVLELLNLEENEVRDYESNTPPSTIRQHKKRGIESMHRNKGLLEKLRAMGYLSILVLSLGLVGIAFLSTHSNQPNPVYSQQMGDSRPVSSLNKQKSPHLPRFQQMG